MKKIKLLFLVVLISQFFFACKKDGELIETKGYGSIAISSTTTTEIGVLLVDVDGKVTDTLQAPTTNIDIKTYTGKRKLKIYQPGKSNAPVIDTVFDVNGNKAKLKFIYTGDIKIIGGGYDGSVAPAKGSSLVQFVNLDKSLPALVDMKIYEVYANDAGDFFDEEVTTIKGINKTGFGPYVEIPPTKYGDYSAGYYYSLFNPANNDKLVDFYVDASQLYFSSTSTKFQPNKVISLGITKDPAGLFTTTIIYDTQLK